MRHQPAGVEQLLDAIDKLDAIEADERSVLDDDGVTALIEISDMRDLIRFLASGIRVGDRFVNMKPELDGADSDDIGKSPYVDSQGERTTPPGSIWRVIDVANAPDSIGIVCEVTGGWINPTFAELQDPEPVHSGVRPMKIIDVFRVDAWDGGDRQNFAFYVNQEGNTREGVKGQVGAHDAVTPTSLVVFDSVQEAKDNSRAAIRYMVWSKLTPLERSAVGLPQYEEPK